MTNPLLSIVIPAHNEESRLPETLDKIDAFLQTQPYSAEVVIVENGSSDRTLELAQEYAGRIKFVKLNTEENPGVPGSLGVRSIPTLVLFKGKDVVDHRVGALPKDALRQMLNQYDFRPYLGYLRTPPLLFGRRPPQSNCPPYTVPSPDYGPRLEPQQHQGGISRLTPRNLATPLQRLPPILHKSCQSPM